MTVDGDLLGWVIALEIVLFAAGVLVVIGHGAVLQVTAPRRRHRLERARAALNRALEGGRLTEAELADIRRMDLEAQVRVFGDLASSLVGEKRDRLVALARQGGLVSRAEAGCRSMVWWRRLQGARLFTILGGGELVVRRLFDDRRVEVRTQAAEWAATHPTPEVVERLVAMLAERDPAGRFSAQDALVRIGTPAVEALATVIEARDEASLAWALDVAARLGDPRLLSPALTLSSDDSPSIRALAARVLGAVGGPVAVERLMVMLHDADPESVVAAVRALGGLSHWPATAAVAKLLGHPAWSVRQQAALALRGLGAPGALFLRKATSDADPLVADIARHVLDLPDSSVQVLAS